MKRSENEEDWCLPQGVKVAKAYCTDPTQSGLAVDKSRTVKQWPSERLSISRLKRYPDMLTSGAFLYSLVDVTNVRCQQNESNK